MDLDRWEHGDKHGRFTGKVGDRRVMGSVRDPWSYYLSLWAYGCDGRGGLFERLVSKGHLGIKYRWFKQRNKRWPSLFLQELLDEIFRNPNLWKKAYRKGDAQAFRQWLEALFSPGQRFALGENYAASPVSRYGGLLSFRYLQLYARDPSFVFSALTESPESLQASWPSHNLVTDFVRQDHLEEDLIKALRQAGYELSAEQEADIYRRKPTNTSTQGGKLNFYDPASLELVGRRESFLVDQHHFKAPDL